jgi:hypothetical protein
MPVSYSGGYKRHNETGVGKPLDANEQEKSPGKRQTEWNI